MVTSSIKHCPHSLMFKTLLCQSCLSRLRYFAAQRLGSSHINNEKMKRLSIFAHVDHLHYMTSLSDDVEKSQLWTGYECISRFPIHFFSLLQNMY